MNKFKKLFPATCLLLVACTLMGTSTFAWFSMNKTVTATGMEIRAKSNTVFLQIKGDNDNGYSQTGTAKSMADTKVFPVSHDVDASGLTDGKPAALSLDNITKTGDGTPWWYAYSAKENESTKFTEAVTLSGTDNIEDYVAHKTFDVNITANSGLNNATDLVVSKMTIGNSGNKISDGVRVIVAGVDGFVEFKATDNDGDTKVITSTIPKDTASTKVEVYIYIDGEDATTYSDNAEELFGEIEFELSCSVPDAN